MSLAPRAWLQRSLERAWSQQAPWLIFLSPLELAFRGIVWLRRALYYLGALPRYRAPVPVVIVGNISVGGSGKTPVVIALVEMLLSQGFHPGVISRGYGRTSRDVCLVQHSSTAREVGDEALLIHRRTGAPCAVHKTRNLAVHALLEKHPVDIVIADDGLQHYALLRDLEVVMYDAATGFGNGHCLPVGPLREPLSRLGSADLVLAKGGGGAASVEVSAVKLVNIQSGEERPASPGSVGTEVIAMAAIARPDSLFDMLRAAGFDVTPCPFSDHHMFCAADIPDTGSRALIMTQKDAVKCAHLVGANAWYLHIDARLPRELIDAVFNLLSVKHH